MSIRVICPICGSSKVDLDQMKCIYCDTKLAYSPDRKKLVVATGRLRISVGVQDKAESAAEEKPAAVSSVPNKRKCPFCGFLHSINATTCGTTGNKLPPVEKEKEPAVSPLDKYKKKEDSPPPQSKQQSQTPAKETPTQEAPAKETTAKETPAEILAKEPTLASLSSLSVEEQLAQFEAQRELIERLERELAETEGTESGETLTVNEKELMEQFGVKKCPHCGLFHEIEASFCAISGERIIEDVDYDLQLRIKKLKCPTCGRMHGAQADYCTITGERIREILEKRFDYDKERAMRKQYKEDAYSDALVKYSKYKDFLAELDPKVYGQVRVQADRDARLLELKLKKEKKTISAYGPTSYEVSSKEKEEHKFMEDLQKSLMDTKEDKKK